MCRDKFHQYVHKIDCIQVQIIILMLDAQQCNNTNNLPHKAFGFH